MTTGLGRQTVPINESRSFEVDEVFFSTTDVKGHIKAGNDVFVRISGYSYEELIGQPHNIIRHPDMPRVVFKVLWDYLESGRTIAAFVKNMAKDGRFYWVMALVTPIPGGYLSVRFKPASPLLAAVAGVYAEMVALERKIESEPGGTRQKGMAASQALLATKLTALGFADYDAFMRVAMLAEIREHNQALKTIASRESGRKPRELGEKSLARLSRSCTATSTALDELFDHIDGITSVQNVVGSIDRFIAESADSMKLLTLNATIEASKLGEVARPVSIVADWLDSSLVAALKETTLLSTVFTRVAGDVQRALFELACAKLQVEVMQNFVRSLGGAEDGKSGVSVDETIQLVRLLCKTMSGQMTQAFKMLEILPQTSGELLAGLEVINKQQRTLRFLHVAGKVETARLPNQTTLSGVLDGVARLIDRTNDEMVSLRDAAEAIRNFVEQCAVPKAAVVRTIEEAGRFAGSLA